MHIDKPAIDQAYQTLTGDLSDLDKDNLAKAASKMAVVVKAPERVRAICDALRVALDGQPERARRMLELWSDTTTEPSAKADGKAARGVPGKA